MTKIWKFLLDNSLLLVIGAVIALVWAQCGESANHVYHSILHWHLPFMDNSLFGTDAFTYALDENGNRIMVDAAGNVLDTPIRHFDVHYFNNDFLMAFFFMSAGKEVF